MIGQQAAPQGVPVAIVLAGGYAVHTEDTVTIHVKTAKMAREVLARVGWERRG